MRLPTLVTRSRELFGHWLVMKPYGQKNQRKKVRKHAQKEAETNLVGQFLSPRAHSLSQRLQHRLGVFPADTRVGDADAVLQSGFAFFWDFLAACYEL